MMKKRNVRSLKLLKRNKNNLLWPWLTSKPLRCQLRKEKKVKRVLKSDLSVS